MILKFAENTIRKSPFKEFIKNSFFFRLYQRSAGNIFYPFHAFCWAIAGFLTRRRTVSVNGVRFSLPCQNWITHFRWFLIQSKETEVRDYIDQYVKDGDTFFDIGANIGVFTLYATCKYKNLKTFSFEPEYSNLSLLKDNIRYNNLATRVNPYSVGVSDFVGISHLHLQDMDEGAAAHTESKSDIENTDEGYAVVGKEGISTITLDYFCEQVNVVPNCMKIDTDGNEVKILNGASRILKDPHFKSLVIEMPYQVEKQGQCKEILEANGFELVWSKRSETLNEVWQKP